MAHNKSPTSIRKALINAVILVTALSLSLSISISSYLDIREQKLQLIDKLETLADITAFNAQVTLLFDDAKTEEQRLKAFKAVSTIKNIHIYKIDEQIGTVGFFASYNAPRTPPVPVRTDSLGLLEHPKISGDTVEVMTAVENDGKTIGYVYIRGSMESIHSYFQHKLLIDVLLTLFVLLVVFFIAKRIQKRIADPIDTLSELLQEVSKHHNYDVRAPQTNIRELNQLAVSLNIMLDRTRKQLERHEKDKEEIRQLNLSLEEKVNHRTIALREANQELLNTLERMHQYQNQIVENEKMASLGQMVAGVAHEVNTPIGLGVTGSTLLSDKLCEIRAAFENKTLTSNQLKRFIDEGIENLDLIFRNLNRAADLVASFKKVAVSQDQESSTELNISDLISDVLLAMRVELSEIEPEMEIDCPKELQITSKSGPIQQVLQQLISNSLIHGLRGVDNPAIRIKIEQQDNILRMDYYDNGTGIPRPLQPRIFDPFVTTKRGEGGSGLGLHLVYNLVTQALGGTIVLDEEHERGVHFILQIPLSEVL